MPFDLQAMDPWSMGWDPPHPRGHTDMRYNVSEEIVDRLFGNFSLFARQYSDNITTFDYAWCLSVRYGAASTMPRPDILYDVINYGVFNQSRNVSWTMAWWSLVPLAIAAMTQPCGKVLGRSDKNFRFYSRASPIVCVADILHFIICVTLGWSFNPKTFIRNVKFELLERFSDDEASGENYSDAERTRLIRWALLIISGVPCQTIKLSVMSGMFCTKLWAISFFSSLVVWELVGLVARSIQTNHLVKLPPPKWRDENSWLSRLTEVVSGMAVALHFFAVYGAATTVFYWAMFSLSDLQFPHAIAITICLTLFMALVSLATPLLSGRKPSFNPFHCFLAVGSMVLGEVITAQGIFTPWLLSVSPHSWDSFRAELQHYLTHERSPSKDAFANILIPWTEMALGVRSGTVGYIAFLSFEVVTGTIFFLGIPRLFSLHVIRRLFKVDTMAGSDAVFIFVSTFLFSLLWYCFIFQPVGTHSPNWTEVFN